ncbi:MAG: CHAT domain-containing protein [Elainella sp. C42_A2020_010]|nr:CHAT domain-containing protein [Elainella sp. C42_A2020_010]
MTQEFDLSVTPVGNNQYLVRTERVPYGAPLAQEQVTWPVDKWLAQARQLMSDPLQGVLQADPARSSLSLIELGQELYASLFQATLRDSWVIAQGVAQNRREPLRLRLGLKGADLLRLPWEVMYGTDVPVERLRQPGSITPAPRPLATGTRIIFSRYLLGTRLVEESLAIPPQLNQPLRILMVVSAPTDQEQLKLYREVKQMQQELQTQSPSRTEIGHQPGPEIQLKILNQPGREQLTQELEQNHYQVLHYAGHSDLSAAGGSLYLVNNRTGLTEVLAGDDLSGLLVNNGIRLAVFNSCRGAHTAVADPSLGQDRNLAEALVSRGIPAVLAMAEQIPDNVALNLTGLFYRSLKLGIPIDSSLNRARQGLISAYGSHQFYWALPVLYLHPEFDGYLMTRDRNRDSLRDPSIDRSSRLPANYGVPPLLQRDLAELPERQPLRSMEDRNVTPARTGPSTEDLEIVEAEARSEEADKLVIAEIFQQLSPPAQAHTNGAAPAAPSHPPDSNSSIPPDSASDVQPQELPSTPPQRSKSRRGMHRFWVLPVLGAAGVALGYFGLRALPQQSWMPDWLGHSASLETPQPSPSLQIDLSQALEDLDPSQTIEELGALAKDSFQNGQVDVGMAAVTVLLDRNALNQASNALKAVPSALKEHPQINFLRGRLAWQGVKAADGEHTVAQARDFWQKSAKDDPENLDYQEALGFTYYVENDLETALKIWAGPNADLMSRDPRVLNFRAAIALAMKKDAANRPPNQQREYILTAIQNYKGVVSRDPKNYSPEALQNNWLWTEAAVRDWKALADIANQQPNQPAASPSPAPVSPTPSPTPTAPAAPAP